MKNIHTIGISAGAFDEYLRKEIERSSKPDFELKRVDCLDSADVVVSNDEPSLEAYAKKGKTCLQLLGTRKNEYPVSGVTQTDISRFLPSLINIIEKKDRERKKTSGSSFDEK